MREERYLWLLNLRALLALQAKKRDNLRNNFSWFTFLKKQFLISALASKMDEIKQINVQYNTKYVIRCYSVKGLGKKFLLAF